MFRTWSLPYDRGSAALARRHVARFATDQDLDRTTNVLALITSELVANAVLHGAEPIELTLRDELDIVTLEVFDGDPAVNNVRSPAASDHAVGGKGLLIVASLADRWGVRPSYTGKTVWATVYPESE